MIVITFCSLDNFCIPISNKVSQAFLQEHFEPDVFAGSCKATTFNFCIDLKLYTAELVLLYLFNHISHNIAYARTL